MSLLWLHTFTPRVTSKWKVCNIQVTQRIHACRSDAPKAPEVMLGFMRGHLAPTEASHEKKVFVIQAIWHRRTKEDSHEKNVFVIHYAHSLVW